MNTIHNIKLQIRRGATLVNNIQKISRIEINGDSIKSIKLCEVLEKSIRLIKKNDEKKINIQVESISDKIIVQADDLLQALFDNILNNALKHNNNPIAEILIRISSEQREKINYYKLEFIDNGKGVEDERKKVIFQRGYEKDRSTSGMGLGLSLVNKIIIHYKGQIWVEDKVAGDYSKGSIFIILIPKGRLI